MDRKGKHGGTLHSYEKGQSGNPAGRPRKFRFISEFIAQLGSAQRVELTLRTKDINGVGRVYQTGIATDEETVTNQLIAFLLLQKAVSGDINAIREVLNRTEGRPPRPLALDRRTDVGAILQAWTDEEVDRYEQWQKEHRQSEPAGAPDQE